MSPRTRRPALALLAAALALAAGPAFAAEEWMIKHESKARMTAKVVDIVCELAGDCPADCGGGRRQLGLLTADGRLVPAVKNQDAFAGAGADLAPFCGREIEVDGLVIDDPQMRMFVVQFLKPPGGRWTRADQFSEDWLDADPGRDAEAAKEWYRHDPRVRAEIERTGKLGIPGLTLGE